MSLCAGSTVPTQISGGPSSTGCPDHVSPSVESQESALQLPLAPQKGWLSVLSFLFSYSEHEYDPDSYKIPFVILSLKMFAPQVHSLLQTHEGMVPLLR